MPDSKLVQAAEEGQSLWLDYINRPMIESGRLQKWVDDGLRGMTSNPTIFEQVISKGEDYDAAIARLRAEGKDGFALYDELTVADVGDACDIFRPVYERTGKLDGYVSLEINPHLANDTAASIKEGRRLFEKVGRPNLMIKVPATEAGFPVIEELIAGGINVNVTLIFSAGQYIETAQAYLRGLKRLARDHEDLSGVRSVASVFISRVDTVVDDLLGKRAAAESDEALRQEMESLKGRAAEANAAVIYALSKDIFTGNKFLALKEKKAGLQRVLWGSTSTKNPAYPDLKYVEGLIAPDTVNTVPEKTLLAFLDHGRVAAALTGEAQEAQRLINRLADFDIRLNDVCRDLLAKGLTAFEQSFDGLLSTITSKAERLNPA